MLICILTTSCVVVAAVIFSLRKEIFYLPDKSADDLVDVLAASGISVDRRLISTKKERGYVYVCGSGDYNSSVATLLSSDGIKYSFAVPDGELIVMSGGARFEFGDGFSFRYYKRGKAEEMPDPLRLYDISSHPSEKKTAEISKIAAEFMDRGSDEFKSSDNMSIVTEVGSVWEDSGKYYALCTRSIDGVEINDNMVLCVIEDGEVVEAAGRWCFLTLGESYSAQLCDIINILFNVKKEIGSESDNVRIESVALCYSLYTYSDGGDFCLIPCWKVVTDNVGEFIYNALNGTIYTKK